MGPANFRDDLLEDLRHAGQFISATTYGPLADAERLIDRSGASTKKRHRPVARRHALSASDPDLLTWVHVRQVSNIEILPALSQSRPARQRAGPLLLGNRLVAERLGARAATMIASRSPPTWTCVHACCDERTREVVRILFNAPAPSTLARPFGTLMLRAGANCCRNGPDRCSTSRSVRCNAA